MDIYIIISGVKIVLGGEASDVSTKFITYIHYFMKQYIVC